MELKELDSRAQKNEPMPMYLPLHEQAYYIAVRGLYQQFADKKITKEQAMKEKELVLEECLKLGESFGLLLELLPIRDSLKELAKNIDHIIEK